MGAWSWAGTCHHEPVGTLPGTAAEILCDEVREVLCPEKLSPRGWWAGVDTGHGPGRGVMSGGGSTPNPFFDRLAG